jgi:hypothetical protein
LPVGTGAMMFECASAPRRLVPVSHLDIRRETDTDPRDALAGDWKSLALVAVHPSG